MEREIKFRAWDRSMKQFKYPKLWDNKMPSNWEYWYELQQYTGKKDKNGIEIYEGDVIKKHYGSSSPMFTVAWHPERLMFIQHDGYNEPLYQIPAEYLEVIGNIYETPELLKEAVK